ncbi:MAG: DUF3034 family protein [bacterium]
MKKNQVAQIIVVLSLVLLTVGVYAGVPLNNLEGVGGIAFNPLAYLAGNKIDSDSKSGGDSLSLQNAFRKPQFGAWYVNLGDVDVDWTTFGVAETVFDRVELSYGHEIIAPTGKNIYKNNFGAKVLAIQENQGGLNFVPAISVGIIAKTVSDTAPGVDDSGVDFYLVGTKLIKELPKPVLVSAGVLATKGLVTGVFGYDNDRDYTVFGNLDVIPLSKLAVGVEYKQGAKFDDFKNANYWNAHVAWFATNNLSLIAAYVNAGDEKSTSKVGLGDGFVLSTQYAF